MYKIDTTKKLQIRIILTTMLTLADIIVIIIGTIMNHNLNTITLILHTLYLCTVPLNNMKQRISYCVQDIKSISIAIIYAITTTMFLNTSAIDLGILQIVLMICINIFIAYVLWAISVSTDFVMYYRGNIIKNTNIVNV